MTTFSHLSKPGKIGSLELKNRMLMAPMGSNFAETDGTCGERIQAFYEERAKGGAAMLTMGVVSVAYPHGTAEPYQVGISEDKFIPGLKQLTDRVHQHGTKIAIQLQHAGKTAVRDLAEGRDLWVPSMPAPHKTDMMNDLTKSELSRFIRTAGTSAPKIRVMDKDDIQQMVQWFANAAERAVKAGFDAIELHAAHTYIIAGFLSGFTNKRDDEYGGPIENRARLLLEVIAAVREKVGNDFPLWLRLDAQELHMPGGITIDDCRTVAKMAEQAGVNAVSVSAYANPTKGEAFTEAPLVHKPGQFIDWAKAVKSDVNIPVITVGRLEPDAADKAINDGVCDFVAFARKLLADPELPNKVLEGRPQDIRPCIYCYACVSQIFVNERVKCAVNPFTGQEAELALTAAEQSKHVVVVGGGPAGMEAARVAALRGHRVTLCEKSSYLGGTLFFATLAYGENGALLDYLVNAVKNNDNIDIRLNTQVDSALLEELNADEVIMAIGANRNAPDIDGADQNHVWSGDELRLLMTGEGEEIAQRKLSFKQRMMMKSGSLIGITKSTDALQSLSKLWMPLNKDVVIIGAGLVGLELAEFLVERGRNVTVLAEDEIGAEISIVRRWRVLANLKQHSVNIIKSASVSQISKDNVIYQTADGETKTVAASSVIIATGAQDNQQAAQTLAGDIKVHNIGDSASVDYIEGALKSATRLAVTL
ncbi:FAD-dependent oxidoreductase [Thalassotalea maritima]|uniref:oxidoreductase n=1 Tax=Thalassotalea maritima TaxID=3242416 RepID=UPI003529947E